MGINCNAQKKPSYESIKSLVRSSWTKGDLNMSIDLLNQYKSEFTLPYQQHTIHYYLGLLYLEKDNIDEAFKVIRQGFKQHFFFAFWPQTKAKIKLHSDGSILLRENEAIRSRFVQSSKVKFEVVLPKNYNATLKYTILYFFHGNNSNLTYLKETWKALNITQPVITVLAQSPLARSNFAYDWIDSTSSINSIVQLHHKMLKEYPIDKSNIICAGFSNGGRMAIQLFLNQPFPVKGFIAFSPSEPKDIVNATELKTKSSKGVIITGEEDYLLPKQIAMANRFYELSMPLRLVVNPNQKHDYPSDFEQFLRSSIDFIIPPE